MSIDIRKAVHTFINEQGVEKVVAITQKPTKTVLSWLGNKTPPYESLEAMIRLNPSLFFPNVQLEQPKEVIMPYEFPAGKRVAILMPSVRPIHIGVMKAVTALYERDKMQFFTIADNSYVRARNWCAQRFLDSGCEWSFWLDDDTVPPHGDVEYFRKLSDNPAFPVQYININPIARLIQTGKTLVGGCYFGRQPGGTAQFKEAYASPMANDAAHAGPRNVVDPVGWIGFGCTLVHRKVFEDIIAQQDVKIDNIIYAQRFGFSYKFFNYIDDESSEDVSFCHRAKEAGHQSFVDMAVMPIHIGHMGYSYHNTKKRQSAPII